MLSHDKIIFNKENKIMKKSIRKIFALLLTFVIIFSISAVPVSAKNIYEENHFMGLIEVYDYGNEEDKNFFEKIKDTFHWYIARIFILKLIAQFAVSTSYHRKFLQL